MNSRILLLGFLLAFTTAQAQFRLRNTPNVSVGIIGSNFLLGDNFLLEDLLIEDFILYETGSPSIQLFGGGISVGGRINPWLNANLRYLRYTGETAIQEPLIFENQYQFATAQELGIGFEIRPKWLRFLDQYSTDNFDSHRFVLFIPIRAAFRAYSTKFYYTKDLFQLNSREVEASGFTYSILGIGADVYLSRSFVLRGEVNEEFGRLNQRIYSVGLFFHF